MDAPRDGNHWCYGDFTQAITPNPTNLFTITDFWQSKLRMERARKLMGCSGCLLIVLAPVVGLLLHPSAKWLFGLALIGVVLVTGVAITRKDKKPQDVADLAERLLNGTDQGYDAEDYEHLNPKNPTMRALWQKTKEVGGFPEDWAALDETKKNELRTLIHDLRRTGQSD